MHSCLLALSIVAGVNEVDADVQERWSVDAVSAWYAQRPWPVGCDFISSTAINQLEMWQADTFDLETIDRELGWAEGIGFNTVRVYLHDIAWQIDPDGFLRRMDEFITIAERHGIAPLFVLFDACWNPLPKPGKQREPRPHVHNSGWVQGPSIEILKDPSRHEDMEPYVTAVLTRFANDTRLFGWDLYNEPGNTNASSYGSVEPPNKEELSLLFLEKVYRWARAAKPQQPLTVGVWGGDWSDRAKMSPLNRFMLDHSDFISFHSYRPLSEVQQRVEELKPLGRPIVCTEYMSRTTGSTFDSIAPYLKEQGIGALNWGLVSGKTQTIYPWDSWEKSYTAEPPIWFHDVFRPDGAPFDAAEVDLLRELTGTRTDAR